MSLFSYCHNTAIINDTLFYFIDINECISIPCLNGGTCKDEVNRYTCTCDPNHKGTHCEIGRLKFIFISSKLNSIGIYCDEVCT